METLGFLLQYVCPQSTWFNPGFHTDCFTNRIEDQSDSWPIWYLVHSWLSSLAVIHILIIIFIWCIIIFFLTYIYIYMLRSVFRNVVWGGGGWGGNPGLLSFLWIEGPKINNVWRADILSLVSPLIRLCICVLLHTKNKIDSYFLVSWGRNPKLKWKPDIVLVG